MRLFVAMAAVVFLGSALPAQAGEADKAQVRELGRVLGYGGAIHAFKNYVLRGTDNYRVDADARLADAAKATAALRAGGKLTDAEKEALDAVDFVLESYRRALPIAQKMIAAGRTPEQIDQVVKIADAPAIWGLEVLRKDVPWTPFETMEAQLGYGGAIHNFKNYVLRAAVGTRDTGGDADRYRSNADAQFAALEKTLAAVEKSQAPNADEKTALKNIAGVLKQYRANLAKVKDLNAKKKTVKEIDAVVKVDDAPALEGLAVWRKKL